MLKKCSYFANSHDWLYLSLFKTLPLTSCGLSAFFHAEEDKKFWENLLTVFDGDFGVLWRYPELESNAAGPNQVLNCVTFTFFSCSRIRYSARDGGDENDLEIEQAMSMSEIITIDILQLWSIENPGSIVIVNYGSIANGEIVTSLVRSISLERVLPIILLSGFKKKF